MFEDFSFCTSCNYYDSGERRCNLFNRQIKVCGCQYGEDKKPRNNFEKIKAMSMEEMAEYLCKSVREGVALVFPLAHYSKKDIAELNADWLEWLKEEVHDS